MIALLTLTGPAVVLGFLFGAAVGRRAGPPRTRAAWAGTVLLLLGTALAGASSGFVPGRPGLWLEAGALVLGAYLGGAALAAVMPGRRPAD